MENNLKKISAVLFLNNDAISIQKIKTISDLEDISKDGLENIFNSLNEKLSEIGLVLLRDSSKSFEKQEVVIVIKKEMSEIAKNLKKNELEGDLTPAALQVMTICAYLSGATKNEINLIRGVQSSQSIRTLTSRGLIKSDSGKYFPTIEVLQYMGIRDFSDLPDYENIQKDFRQKLSEFLEEEK
jgi:segregation and condensation protein B